MQTAIHLEAQTASPKLVSISGGNGTVCDNSEPEALISSLDIRGSRKAISWKLNQKASRFRGNQVDFVYESASPKLRLDWKWDVSLPSGPIQHTIVIRNLNTDEIWIPMQYSFSVRCRISPGAELEHFFVEKGAGEPSSVGTHRVPILAGYQWAGTSSTYAHPKANEPREIIPFFSVALMRGRQPGFYVGIEFSGRTLMTLSRDATFLSSAVGLNPDPGSYRTRLNFGGEFETPTVFIGAFQNGQDELGNVLRPWVRDALSGGHAWRNPQFPLLVNNSWGSGMQVDEALAQRMIADSSALGLEMFHVDAGWFRAVGDWYPDRKKFPHGLAAIADSAHRHGLRFGIWSDWTQAALGTSHEALNLRNPQVRDWTISDLPADWKPEEFKGQTIDIGVAAARDYARREVLRLVGNYHLDMLEHDGYLVADGCMRTDHIHAPPDPKHVSVEKDQGSYFVTSSNSTDVSYYAVRAYYEIQSALRKQYPGLLLEVCNDGGRMVDFGSAAHGDYFSITDTYTPLANRRAFYDASYLLPAAMLEAYVAKWDGVTDSDSFRYMLRSGMMGWFTLMLDTSAWTQAQREIAKDEFTTYRTQLRSFIRGADLYHVSARPDGIHWDAVEYFDPHNRKGVIYAFRGSEPAQPTHVFKLQGLKADKRYRLSSHDHRWQDKTETGQQLLSHGHGLSVSLPSPNSSDLILINEL